MALPAAALFLAGCGGGGGGGGIGGTATVSGRVVQATTGIPIEGATVSLSAGGSAVTDAAGRFSITTNVLGTQTLSVQAPGYDSVSISVTVQAGENSVGDIKLPVASSTNPPDKPATISGTVRLAGESDFSGAIVTLLFDGTVYDSVTTPASGVYGIWAPVGDYVLRVEKAGFVTFEQQVKIVDTSSVLVIDVTLERQ